MRSSGQPRAASMNCVLLILSSVVPGEEEPWFAWLSTHTSFAFQGQASRLTLRKESRPRGEGYWYAYHWHQWQARKRYLGRTATLTLARLEAVAQTLSTEPFPEPARAPAERLRHLPEGCHILPLLSRLLYEPNARGRQSAEKQERKIEIFKPKHVRGLCPDVRTSW
jgi:hypothetical protein